MGKLLDERRRSVDARIKEFQNHLHSSENRCAGKACVYMTGSFARGEASKHSDLDLFIVSKCKKNPKDSADSLLSRLDDICVKAELIQTARDLKFPEFSGDGEYLTKHTDDGLIKTLEPVS